MNLSPSTLASTARTVLDTVATATDTITAMDLATVMGAGVDAGALSIDEIRQALGRVIPARSSSGATDRNGLLDRLAGVVRNQIKDACKRTADDNKARLEPLQQAVSSNRSNLTTVKDTVNELADRAAALQGDVATTRQDAVKRFNESLSLVVDVTRQLQTHDDTIDKISKQLDETYSNQDATQPDVGAEINRLQKLRQNVEDERTHKERLILEHFDESIRGRASDAKKQLSNLVIPKQLDHGKGQELIDNLHVYLRGRASEYYAILPYLYRISADYDTDTGIFYQPPSKQSAYEDVDEAIRQQYTLQSQALFTELKRLTPKEIILKITSTFKYGIHEQLTARCAEGDGPMAYFSLLSLYRPSAAAFRDNLEEKFNQAWHHFTKGDPKAKIQYLRGKLAEVIKLQVPIKWSTTGKKIAQVLSRRDTDLAMTLRPFKDGPDKPSATAQYLDEMFSAIEIECENILRVGGEIGVDKTWNANSADASNSTQSNHNTKLCRYGNKCHNKNCRFAHPGDNKRQRDNQAGKHGRGNKRDCAAKGCSQKTPDAVKRFCTTCFKKGLQSGGIMLKDGTTHEIKSRMKKDDKSLYGFSAQQLEGLKLLSKRNSSDGSDGEEPDSRAAPASVKRRRAANSARGEQQGDDTTVQQFLNAINHQ